MGMFGDLGTSIGGIFAGGRQASGYKRAGAMWNAFKEDAEETRKQIDPWGVAGRRNEMGDLLHSYMTGEKDITGDPGYKFVRDQALQATARQNAASGFGPGINSSGNAGIALQNRAAGLASTEYKSILDRLTNLSSAGQAAGIAGGQMYGDMMGMRMQGMTGSKIGKYNALAARDQATHSAIGQTADILTSVFASDARLKKDIRRIGKDGALNKYKWTWNALAEEAFGLTGEDTGYIAQEVRKVMPEAVTTVKGYLAIDYNYLHSLEEVA